MLREYGELRAQPASDWVGPLLLPVELERYYREIGPVDILIDGLGDPCFLPELAGLWDFQAGYRSTGSTAVTLPEWNDDWLAVAEQGSDAFVFSQRTGRISIAQQAAGSWAAQEIFADLNELSCCLCLLGSVAAESDAEALDDSETIAPEYRVAAEFGLTDLLGSAERAVQILALLGWG